MKKIKEGSNKNIYQFDDGSGDVSRLLFEFTDRVSVFDWGDLGASLDGRGEAMRRFAVAMAKHFESEGVATSFLSEESEKAKAFVSQRVALPNEDFKSSKKFLPVEILLRWGVPLGSSLLKKDDAYQLGQRFEKLRIDYTTKLENIDRPLDDAELQSVLSDYGVDQSALETFVTKAGVVLEKFALKRGLELWDAKIEVAYDQDEKTFLVVDSFTPDEWRATLKGAHSIPLSKEIVRQWYRQTPWFQELRRAKSVGDENWKSNVKLPVPALGPWRSQCFVGLYEALADLAEDASSKALWTWLREKDQKLAPRVYVIGEGGREKAVKWQLEEEGAKVTLLKNTDEALALNPEETDAVWVSMDGDLALGAVDQLAEKAFWVFGPRKEAAKIEWSKTYGREVADRAGIPSPLHSSSQDDFSRDGLPPVVKEDALAAGKGVFVPPTWEDFDRKVSELKSAGKEFYFEEQLSGEEASLFYYCSLGQNGKAQAQLIGHSKDFKRRFLGDEGPNKGGMGALAPHPNLKD